jgi:hypothetical protein
MSEITEIVEESSRLLGELSRAASKASAQSSSTLFGVIGGFVGMAFAFGFSPFVPVSIAVLGPACTGIGITLAVLLCRGRSRLDLERSIDANRLAANEVLDRIKALPSDTPTEVRDELWATYKALNSLSAIFGRRQEQLPFSSNTVLTAGRPNQDE